MKKPTTSADLAARRREVQRLTDDGHSQNEIAKQLGVSRSLVQKDLRHMREAKSDAPFRRAAASTVVKRHTHSGASNFDGVATIMPPPDHLSQWKRMDLDRNTFGKASSTELLGLIANVSPEASKAVWDWLRLVNAGHEIAAYKTGTDEVDERATAVLMEFVDKLERYHGSFKTIAGQLFMSALTRGAFFGELVLDQTGKVPLDIVIPDPATIRFKLVEVQDRGHVWVPGQWQDGEFVLLDMPTVQYLALDPETGSPYGRPMLGPAVFPTVFLIGVLHDLRRVISQQGYPRTDVIVKLERIREAYHDLEDEEFEEKVDELIAEVQRDLAGMEPDDQYVHTDVLEVDRASGAVETTVMQGASAVIEVLERMATKALKSTPLLMGNVEGGNDANANRQWEIHAVGVRTVQHYAESLLGGLLTTSLRVQGIVADVRVRFAEIRAAEELRDAQTLIAKLRGAELAERLGYWTADEAAEHATGHGIPEELRGERVPLINTSNGSGPDATDATQLDGNEHSSSDGRTRKTGARATELPQLDMDRVNAAVQTWRNAFEGESLANLLDAEVVEGDE